MPKRFFLLLVGGIFLISLFFLRNVLIKAMVYPSPINPNSLKDSHDNQAKIAIFNNQKIDIPNDSFENTTQIESKVLGESNSLSKRIEVDLSKQRLYAYEGSFLKYSFLISSGKWNSTPNGTFKIWAKIKSQKMSGGSKELGTYYYLPNVPYIMFFYNEKTRKSLGYSLHGTYWHKNFGTPMSHGCINMITSDAKELFYWAEIDTPVTIYNRYSSKKT